MGGANLVIQDLKRTYERHKSQMFDEIIAGEAVHSPQSELSYLPVEIRVRWMEEGWECMFASLEAGEPVASPSSFMPSNGEVEGSDGEGLLHELMLIIHRTAEFVDSLCPYLVQDYGDDPEYLSSLLLMLGRGSGMYAQSYVRAYLEDNPRFVRSTPSDDAGEGLRQTLEGMLVAAQAATQKTRRAIDRAMTMPEGPSAGSLSEISCDLATTEARLDQMAGILRQSRPASNGDFPTTKTESARTRAMSPAPSGTPDPNSQAAPRAPESEHPFGRGFAESLTPRQVEVARLVAIGYTNKHIAEELTLSPNTVRNHIARILEATGLKNRSQIASAFAQISVIGTK